eukprot:TRINITY_DN4307_c1_g1_i4.p1 TRINITY_DN4307_c1_g1~~TRINITY_DN4307_c1_g1_i4.p1  ORF type:complete len:396 (+),score=107.78 TRINITY_DN4307_c1_g1_i4:1013-2200(+)
MKLETSILVIIVTFGVVVSAIQPPVPTQQERIPIVDDTPTKPPTPKDFQSTLSWSGTPDGVGTGGERSFGLWYYSKSQNSMRYDTTYNYTAIENLYLGTERIVISLMNETNCYVRATDHDVMLFDEFENAEYNRTIQHNGAPCTLWTAGLNSYCFNQGGEPVLFKLANDPWYYHVNRYQAGEQPSSLFAVPPACRKGAKKTMKTSPSKSLAEKLHPESVPQRPETPIHFSGDLNVFNGGSSLNGRFWFSDVQNFVRADYTSNGHTFSDLFDYNDNIYFTVILDNNVCNVSALSGNASSWFTFLKDASFDSTDSQHNCDLWIFKQDGGSVQYKFCFNGNTPVYYEMDTSNMIRFSWSNVDMSEPNAGVFDIPSICHKTNNDQMVDSPLLMAVNSMH